MSRAMRQRRIVKLGGSLLELPDVVPRLRRWLACQPIVDWYVVVGGGERVERLRDQQATVDDETSHWLAIDAMVENARQLADQLEASRLISRRSEIVPWPATSGSESQTRVLDARALLDEIDQEVGRDGNRLPIGWHVTSDSIAAYLAYELHADELVLLKSCLPPDAASATGEPTSAVSNWIDAGYVDPYFAVVCDRLTAIRCVDLRADEAPEVWYTRG